MGVGRTAAGLKELMYHMMKVIRLNCKYGGKKQTNRSIVTECPVYVFGRMIDDKMVIRKCQLEHNHWLSPKDSRFMVNYRSIDDRTAGKITNNDQVGISIAKSYNTLLVETEGHENITYNQRDVRKVVHLNRRKSRLEVRVQPRVYSAIKRDNDGRLMNAFWVTLEAEQCIKTLRILSHLTLRSCATGCHDIALYVQLRYFHMRIHRKLCIMTNQRKAIGKAVELCLLGCPIGCACGTYYKMLQGIWDNFPNPDKFDEAWGLMVEKFGIHDNAWLKETYEIRGRWAPAYWRSTFWARMSSTQRSERINRFFKDFVSIETGLLQFIRQYEAALKGKVEEEKLLNFNSTHKPPICDKNMIVQYVFQKAYTNTKFLEVKAECDALKLVSESKTASLGGLKKDGRRSLYHVTRIKITSPALASYLNSEVSCASIIEIIEFEGVNVKQERYILSRWREDNVMAYEGIKVSYYDPEEFDRVKRVRELS
ncbi:Protein FAR-RED IMPAIRED RESPONSE 1 [Bienertia sinuspersici]